MNESTMRKENYDNYNHEKISRFQLSIHLLLIYIYTHTYILVLISKALIGLAPISNTI